MINPHVYWSPRNYLSWSESSRCLVSNCLCRRDMFFFSYHTGVYASIAHWCHLAHPLVCRSDATTVVVYCPIALCLLLSICTMTRVHPSNWCPLLGALASDRPCTRAKAEWHELARMPLARYLVSQLFILNKWLQERRQYSVHGEFEPSILWGFGS